MAQSSLGGVGNRAVASMVRQMSDARPEATPAVPIQRTLAIYVGPDSNLEDSESRGREDSSASADHGDVDQNADTLLGLDASLVEAVVLNKVMFYSEKSSLRDDILTGVGGGFEKLAGDGWKPGPRRGWRLIPIERLAEGEEEVRVYPGEMVVFIGHGKPGTLGPFTSEEVADAVRRIRDIHVAGCIYFQVCHSAEAGQGVPSLVEAVAEVVAPNPRQAHPYRMPVIGARGILAHDIGGSSGDLMKIIDPAVADSRNYTELFRLYLKAVDKSNWRVHAKQWARVSSERELIANGEAYLRDEVGAGVVDKGFSELLAGRDPKLAAKILGLAEAEVEALRKAPIDESYDGGWHLSVLSKVIRMLNGLGSNSARPLVKRAVDGETALVDQWGIGRRYWDVVALATHNRFPDVPRKALPPT